MFRSVAPYIPPVATAAILGTLAIHEFDHLAPENLKVHLQPLLGRRREPPPDFAGDATPQTGVFAGNDRHYSAVLVLQAAPSAERRGVARSAAKACLKWSDKDVDVSLGLGPRIWDAVKGHVPLGNVAANSADFKLKDRSGEKTSTKIANTGGDILVHVKADSQGKCVEVVRSVLQEFHGTPLAWSEDLYGHKEEHVPTPMCPTTSTWANSAANLCRMACVPKVGSSYALFQKWEDDATMLKGKAKPVSNHSERMRGMDQEGNKLAIVKHTMRTGRLGTRLNDDKAGMLFVAYSADPRIFDYMLDRMVGKRGGVEDNTLQLSKCTRAQLFYVPSQAQVNALGAVH